MIILLNGPPRSGKDTVYRLIRKYLTNSQEYKMSSPLKKCFLNMFNTDTKTASMLLEGEYKDTPFMRGSDMSPRQFQIDMSEEFMKPKFGIDVFGRIAVFGIKQLMAKHAIISDCGFAEEIKPIQEEFGYDNILAIQLSRPNCDYTNDSRGDLDFEALRIPHVKLNNDYDLEMLEVQVKRILKKWELIPTDG